LLVLCKIICLEKYIFHLKNTLFFLLIDYVNKKIIEFFFSVCLFGMYGKYVLKRKQHELINNRDHNLILKLIS
jgi:hypothetical protein